MAKEKNIKEEEVFMDREYYFELMQRSFSPEEMFNDAQESAEKARIIIPQIYRNRLRNGTLAVFSDDDSVSVDDIDKKVELVTDLSSIKTTQEEHVRDFQSYLFDYVYFQIERYWGKEALELFK